MIKATDNKSTSSKAKQPAGNSFFGKEEGGGAFFGEKETAKEPFFVQRKLSIGKPDDHYEKQADQVADKVVQRMSEPAAVQAKTVAPAPVSTVPSGHTPSSAAQPDALQMKEQEGKEEEISGEEKKLQRKPIFDSMGDPPDDIQKKGNGDDAKDTASSGLEDRLQKTKGSGTPLPSDTKTAMESSIGADFSNVRVHTGTDAAALSNDLQAQAFTHGNDIYFNDNKFDATSSTGRHLLAHELTHTVQQGAAVQKKADPGIVPAVQKAEGSAAGDTSAEDKKETPDVQSKAVDTIQRAPGGKPAAAGAPGGAPGEVVNISSGRFNPSKNLIEAIKGAGHKGLDVNINAGKVAGAGVIKVREKEGVMESLKNAYLPLNMPLFSAANPMLAVRLANGEVSGFATIGQSNAPEAIPQWLRKNGKALGWLTGMDVENVLSKATNTFENGTFTFALNAVKVKVGGFAEATMDIGFTNMKPSVSATAELDIHGVAKGNLTITLMEDKMTGEGAFGVSFKGFSGEIAAKFQEGVLDVKGMVGYSGDRLSGSLMLVMTDKKTADNFAKAQVGTVSAEEAALPAEVPAAEGKGPRGMAGMGTLTFNMTEWFAGSVNVIVDGKGFVTVVGKIAPPKEIILFQQRDYSKELFKLEARAAYGIPVIGNVFVFANMALIAMAKVGPAKIYNIEVAGTYSNNPDIAKNISLSGSLNMSAYAGLRLRAEGGAGLELAGHDLKVGVGVNADAGVKGYVDARPTIGYRDPGEFFFKGHMEIAAQPFLGLSGDLFVELDSPWWSPLPDKKWTWPIGALEYPLPGEFGIGADMEYVLGSGKVPEVSFSEAKFDGTKFMTDLVDDHVPQKSGAGDKEKQGKFVDGGAAQAGPAKGTPPPAAPGKPGAGGTPAGGAPGAGGGKGKDKDKGKGKADPDAVKNFAAAMKKVKELEGHKPMTRTELMATLDGIKKQFNVSGISFAAQGTDLWMVTGTMAGMPNKQSVKVKAIIKPGDEKDEKQDKDAEKQLAEGVKALIAKDKETAAGDKKLTKTEAEKVAADVEKTHNKTFKSINVIDKKDHWNYLYIQRMKKSDEVTGSGMDTTPAIPPGFVVGAYFNFGGEIYKITEIKKDQDKVHMVNVKNLLSNKNFRKKKPEDRLPGERVFTISIALSKGSITEYSDTVPAVRKFPASWGTAGSKSVRPWLYDNMHNWKGRRNEINADPVKGKKAMINKVLAAKAKAIAGDDKDWKVLSKHDPTDTTIGAMIINEGADYNNYDPYKIPYEVDHIHDLGNLWTTIGRDSNDSTREKQLREDTNLRVVTEAHNIKMSGDRYEMSVGPNFISSIAEDNTPGAKTIRGSGGKAGAEEPFL
ncbi:DUF4157 domain-containing protein [Chitinophaga sp. CF418]|uniref:eCIS core domain-containing protein n=1 Tax=Chitinophaga sp. CF418 TaxID=1855287 RepID=UPI0009185C66|nr:DUF4157 domain-containing protein [Chitinophaga sp. CF418]SHN32776.1 protein of unknown function [Chitinophaga sp. CF418]